MRAGMSRVSAVETRHTIDAACADAPLPVPPDAPVAGAWVSPSLTVVRQSISYHSTAPAPFTLIRCIPSAS